MQKDYMHSKPEKDADFILFYTEVIHIRLKNPVDMEIAKICT